MTPVDKAKLLAKFADTEAGSLVAARLLDVKDANLSVPVRLHAFVLVVVDCRFNVSVSVLQMNLADMSMLDSAADETEDAVEQGTPACASACVR